MLQKYKYHLLLHFIVLIWGFTAILGKLISLDASSLVWYRMLIAITAIAGFMLFSKISFDQSKSSLLRFLGVGILITLHWVTFYKSIKVSNVSVAVVCLSSATFFTAIFEPFFFRKRIIIYELLFGVAVMLGLYLIFQIDDRYTEGMIYGIASAIFSSLFTVFNGKLTKTHDSTSMSFYELTGGLLGLTVYFAFSDSFDVSSFHLSFSDLMYLILLGTVCTAFAFVASVQVMKEINPFTVVLSINLEPVYSIIIAFFLFGDEERMTTGFYIGTLFILSTLLLNAYFKSRVKALS